MIFDIDDQNEDKMYMVESVYTQKQRLKGTTTLSNDFYA